MTPHEQYQRYQDLQRYVGWTDQDARNVQSVAALLDPHLRPLIDDFYDEIDRHPGAKKVITGGQAQIDRLKGTLLVWIRELLSGLYDQAYVARRWRVGWRHVEIGLDQVYTNAALSRLRRGLIQTLDQVWPGDPAGSIPVRRSLNMLMDLDLAIIEDAYQAEHLIRRERAERLATIGQVGAGVAHELRNPLNVIKTSIYYLLNARNPSPEKTAEHLKRIERQVLLADGVVTALSNYAKMPVPDLKPIALPAAAAEAVEANPVPAGVHVIYAWPADLPPVLADAGQLRIVLGNLVRNACEAMPQGGRLTLSARRRDDGHLELHVADTGVGIPPEVIARVMEPLYTTKAKGLGLGLALCRAIVDKMKGSLSVTSTPGAGSTFTVRLAAADEGGTV